MKMRQNDLFKIIADPFIICIKQFVDKSINLIHPGNILYDTGQFEKDEKNIFNVISMVLQDFVEK
jgi:hypothetical protein